MMFAHPSQYALPNKKGRNDFDLPLPPLEINEASPLYGAVIVAPFTDQPTVVPKLPRMTRSTGVAVGLRGFERTPDLLVQVVIGYGPQGPWPAQPWILVNQPAGKSPDSARSSMGEE
jgi:hypothetical protein